MSKHTPGPWDISQNRMGVLSIGIMTPSGAWVQHEVATVDYNYSLNSEERLTRIANARLIAAAPELLQAAERFRDMLWNDERVTLAEEMDALIAKATGESQ